MSPQRWLHPARGRIVGLLAAVLLAPSLPLQAQDRIYEPIQPVAPARITDPARVELGKKLWFDPRLSRSGVISCNFCHQLSLGGMDNLPSSVGHGWQRGTMNAPTVFNASRNLAQFWDGRARDLQEQAAEPIANPVEMAFTHELAVETLRTIPQYVAEFQQVFGHGELDMAQVSSALAAFEETLVTPNARFDQWLRGDDGAISEQELRGYRLFKDTGCVACHNGPNVGGNSYQRFGLIRSRETDHPSQGRAGVTGDQTERYYFRVPSLRNVERTQPYFHDGSAQTLREAVDTMARLQLGRELSAEQSADIVAFLRTLTGEPPVITLPALPPSGDRTPRPRPFD